MEYERHELSKLFGDMPEEDFTALKRSIEADGLLKPIDLLDDKILDGWHRYRACLDVNVEPSFTQIETDDPAGYVIAMNALRRHMTPSQRAIVIVRAREWNAIGRREDGGFSAREMAEEAGVSVGTIKSAKEVVRVGRADEVATGDMTLNKILREEKRKTEPASPAEVQEQAETQKTETLAAAKRQIAKLQDDLTAHETEITGLEEQIDDLQERYNELVAAAADPDSGLQRLSEAIKRVSELEQARDRQMERANAEMRHRQALEARIDRVRNFTIARDWNAIDSELKIEQQESKPVQIGMEA